MPPQTSAKPAVLESKPLALNGEIITIEVAIEKLSAIYGSKRAPEIIAGLNDGTHGGASVAEGYIKIVKEQPIPAQQPVSPTDKEK